MTAVSPALVVKAFRDLRPRLVPVDADIRPDGHGRYPLDLRGISRQFHVDHPEDVVAVAGPDGRPYHNPVSVSLYALARHTEASLNGGSMARFLTQARHLRASQDARGGWRYPVPVPRYRVTPGWYSAMAQGMAVSVLLRAYDLTGEPSYLDTAAGAEDLLLKPSRAGGCADYDEAGQPFLEECPTDPPCHILNGAVYALIGLAERQARTGGAAHIPAARRLAAQLWRYDLGYWSRYDLRFTAPATLAYHSLHVALLEAAERLFAEELFGRTAARWRSYLRHPGHRLRAAAGKALFVLGQP